MHFCDFPSHAKVPQKNCLWTKSEELSPQTLKTGGIYPVTGLLEVVYDTGINSAKYTFTDE